MISVKLYPWHRVSEQVPATKSRLQSGDVFILDMGLKVFQWNGSGASVFEKHKVINHLSQAER